MGWNRSSRSNIREEDEQAGGEEQQQQAGGGEEEHTRLHELKHNFEKLEGGANVGSGGRSKPPQEYLARQEPALDKQLTHGMAPALSYF